MPDSQPLENLAIAICAELKFKNAEPKPEKKPEPKPKPESKPEPKKPEPKTPDFKQPSMEEVMAEEALEMARKDDAKTENEAPGSGDESSDVSEETASYEDAVRAAISRRWRIPGNYRNRNDLSVQVRIQVIPGGEVSGVSVAKSSGYPNFDESLMNAVKLASPLPVPEGSLFEKFRTFTIAFQPGDAR